MFIRHNPRLSVELLLFSLIFFGFAHISQAQSTPPLFDRVDAVGAVPELQLPSDISSTLSSLDFIEILDDAVSSAPEVIYELERLSLLNEGGPEYVGISRDLSSVYSVTDTMLRSLILTGESDENGFQALPVDEGGLIFGKFGIRDSRFLRAQIDAREIPEGVQVFVRGVGEGGFLYVPIVEGSDSNWSPPIAGEEILLAVLVPANVGTENSFELRIPRLMEAPDFIDDVGIRSGQFPVRPDDYRDAQCFSGHRRLRVNYEPFRRAVGMLSYVRSTGGNTWVDGFCSGGLLNNSRNNGDPLFLTANHCFVGDALRDAQPSDVQGVYVFWDYLRSSCTASPPPPWTNSQLISLPSSNGATLLASSWRNDFTLIRLANLPTNRVFLGTRIPDYRGPDSNMWRYRFHHPNDRPMNFSLGFWEHSVEPSIPNRNPVPCPQRLPSSQFVYSAQFVNPVGSRTPTGAMGPGSSGSVLIDYEGYVVGQLYGWCRGAIGRSDREWAVDGRISETIPRITQWINP